MKSFQDILQNSGQEFLDNLMDNYVLVYEKLSASTLSFRRIGDELHFYKGSDKEEITSINATLYTYFQNGIDYIKRVSLIFYREFPEGWLFKCQYFVDNKTNLIEYDYTPQNNLILSCIDNGTNLIEDPDVLKRWAERLQIDWSQPLFQGFLSEFQKEKINDYVNGKADNSVPFSQYIVSLLNPSLSHSAYKTDFSGGVDSFIFKFYTPNSKKCVCAKIVDPYMLSIIQKDGGSFSKDKFSNENEIILANFIAYLQTVDMKEVEVEGDTDEDRYMDMLCKLFNSYIKKEKSLFDGIKESRVNENYGVNLDNIKNEETAKLLKDNPNLNTAFQIIVGSFLKYKNPNDVNPLSLLNSDLIDMFNREVDHIKVASHFPEEKVLSFKDIMGTEKKGDDKVLSFKEFMHKLENDSKPDSASDFEPKKMDTHTSADGSDSHEDKRDTHKEEEHKEEGKKEDKDSHEDKKQPKGSEGGEGGEGKSEGKPEKKEKEDAKSKDKKSGDEVNKDKPEEDKKEETEEGSDEKTEDDSKEEPEEKQENETKEDESKEEPKDEPKDEPKEEPKEEPKDEPKEEPKEEPKDEPKEEPKEEPKNEPKGEPKSEPKSEPEPKQSPEPKEKPKKEKPKKEPAGGGDDGPKPMAL